MTRDVQKTELNFVHVVNIAWLKLSLSHAIAKAQTTINEAVEAEEFYQLQGFPAEAEYALTLNLEEIANKLREEFTRIRRDYKETYLVSSFDI